MMQEPITSFGYWIRRRRKAIDMTQPELADRVGCSVSAIRKIESDERRPSAQIAELLADALLIEDADRPLFIQVARGVKSTTRLDGLEAPPLAAATAAIAAAAPASTTPPVRPSPPRLPIPPTPLIGRTAEQEALAALLDQPDCRIISLVGAGGIGKTRLALAVAAAYGQKVGAVFLAPLAAIQSPDLVAQAIATAIGFTFGNQGEPEQQLLAYLRDQQILIVLDNIEHLLSTHSAGEPPTSVEALLGRIAARAPGVKLLVTAREPLTMRGEWVFELHGLATPPPATLMLPEEELLQTALRYEAVQLFVDCARRTQHDFALTASTCADVTRICILVDGMPLGIELATAWGRTLAYHEIAAEIERSIDFLAVKQRNLPERQRSLRATFEYSWRLLNVEEQQVLARLAVFAGGFTREAAADVARASLPVLSSLAAKSLVRRVATPQATRIGVRRTGDVLPTRYELHELVRQFAAAKLQEDGAEQTAAHTRHARYYLQFLEQQHAPLVSSEQKSALQWLTTELANLRQAWEWAVQQEQAAALRSVAWTFWYFFELRNYFQEGETTFHRARQHLQTLPAITGPEAAAREVAWANLLTHEAFFVFRRGDPDAALAHATVAAARLRGHCDLAALGDALWAYGAIAWVLGEFAAATAALDEALAISRTTQSPWPLAVNHTFLGIVRHEQGDYVAAEQLLSEGYRLARLLGDPRPISFSSSFLSRTAQALGRYDRMLDVLGEGLRLASETGDRFGQGIAIEQLAQVSHALGRTADAERYFAEGLTLYRAISDVWSLARVLNNMGTISLAHGDLDEAQRLFTEALHDALEATAPPSALEALTGLAAVHAQQGDDGTALALAAAVTRHPSSPQAAAARAAALQQELMARLTSARVVRRALAHAADDLAELAALLKLRPG
jgi:predicted ATPase/transcriptional regulator with XRE-family HTH domain